MNSFGKRALGAQMERMQASAMWNGPGFRNVHPPLTAVGHMRFALAPARPQAVAAGAPAASWNATPPLWSSMEVPALQRELPWPPD